MRARGVPGVWSIVMSGLSWNQAYEFGSRCFFSIDLTQNNVQIWFFS